MVVGGVPDVDLQALAEPAGVFVEGRFEPAGPQAAARQPVRREACIAARRAAASRSGAPKSSRGEWCRGLPERVVPPAGRCRRRARAIHRWAALGLGLIQVRSPRASRSPGRRRVASRPWGITRHRRRV